MIITILVLGSVHVVGGQPPARSSEVARAISTLNLSTVELMVIISIFYIILGCFSRRHLHDRS